MINNAAKRAIIRAVHLILSIPILGYIYGEPKDVAQYAGAVRFAFVPIVIFSGYWMYSGAVFALLGAAAWLAALKLSGYGAALLSQVVLFIGRKVWKMSRAKARV